MPSEDVVVTVAFICKSALFSTEEPSSMNGLATLYPTNPTSPAAAIITTADNTLCAVADFIFPVFTLYILGDFLFILVLSYFFSLFYV